MVSGVKAVVCDKQGRGGKRRCVLASGGTESVAVMLRSAGGTIRCEDKGGESGEEGGFNMTAGEGESQVKQG